MGDSFRPALWVVCLTAATGCSGGTSTAADAGHDSGSDAGEKRDTGNGGEMACGFECSDTCGACVKASCCSEWNACATSAPCSTLDHCLLACKTTACLSACSNASTMAT